MQHTEGRRVKIYTKYQIIDGCWKVIAQNTIPIEAINPTFSCGDEKTIESGGHTERNEWLCENRRISVICKIKSNLTL